VFLSKIRIIALALHFLGQLATMKIVSYFLLDGSCVPIVSFFWGWGQVVLGFVRQVLCHLSPQHQTCAPIVYLLQNKVPDLKIPWGS
jgi:hypothetical protein